MGNQLAVNPNETAVPPSQLKANQDGKMSCCCTTSACIEHMIVSCYMSPLKILRPGRRLFRASYESHETSNTAE